VAALACVTRSAMGALQDSQLYAGAAAACVSKVNVQMLCAEVLPAVVRRALFTGTSSLKTSCWGPQAN